MTSLFDPIKLGGINLKNRIIMAPMTRSRANEEEVPGELTVEYYRQRASAGLIITEATQPSANGKGYPRTPGIYTQAQIAGWQRVTEAVHQAGGKIFLQIMHVGRIAHPLNKTLGAETIAPSAIKAVGQMYTDQQGLQEMAMPRALETHEIPLVIEEYKQATINAFVAGFDGVELHAASGYLPMQFLSSNTNIRTDQYGGSVTNRIRFVIELLEAMIAVKGSSKVGIRIWPDTTFNDIHDANPIETHTVLLKAINSLNLSYVHMVKSPDKSIELFELVHNPFQGVRIVNGGMDLTLGQKVIESGLADLVAYGTLFLANPDLVERFRRNASLNTPDPNTFYSSDAKGYIDYPFLAD